MIYHLGPKSDLSVNQEGVQGITGAEAADGIDECRKVVRRQIGAGADWIKVRPLKVCTGTNEKFE